MEGAPPARGALPWTFMRQQKLEAFRWRARRPRAGLSHAPGLRGQAIAAPAVFFLRRYAAPPAQFCSSWLDNRTSHLDFPSSTINSEPAHAPFCSILSRHALNDPPSSSPVEALSEFESWERSRSGAWAGRGFHYQYWVAVLVLLRQCRPIRPGRCRLDILCRRVSTIAS